MRADSFSHVRREEPSSAESSSQKRNWLKYAGWSLGFLLALCVTDGIYVALGVRDSLRASLNGLATTRAAIVEGKIAVARDASENALSEAGRALSLSRHPSVVITAFLPRLGIEARAVRGLAVAADLSAEAANLGVQAAQALEVGTGSPQEALLQQGRIRLGPLESAIPLLEGVESLLNEGGRVLRGLDQPTIGPLTEALTQARSKLSDAAVTMQRTVALLRVLPPILGEGKSRQYLLAFQTPGEARGTGGFLGAYGVLSARRGRLRIEELAPIRGLPNPTRPVSAPRWFEQSYGRFALTDWRQANSSPTFPVVAQVWLDMWKQVRGESLDGVLAMDPVALSVLLPATGPLDLPADQPDITSENATKVLLHDSYLIFDEATQSEYLTKVVQVFWSKVSRGEFDSVALTEGLIEAFQTRHMMFHSTDSEPSVVLQELKLDGDPHRYGSSIQMLFGNNYSLNKVDYFLERSIDTTVRFNLDGSASVTAKVLLTNKAPAGPPSLLLGSEDPGRNGTVLSLMLPEGSHSPSIAVDGGRSPTLIYEDDGLPVVWSAIDVLPGKKAKVEINYQLPAIYPPGGVGTFSLTLVPQATVVPDRYSMTFIPPPNYRLRYIGRSKDDSSSISIRGVLQRPTRVEIELAASPR